MAMTNNKGSLILGKYTMEDIARYHSEMNRKFGEFLRRLDDFARRVRELKERGEYKGEVKKRILAELEELEREADFWAGW